MAISVFDSVQTISYSARCVNQYFGFRISTGGESLDVHCFSSKEQKSAALRFFQLLFDDHPDTQPIVALLLYAAHGPGLNTTDTSDVYLKHNYQWFLDLDTVHDQYIDWSSIIASLTTRWDGWAGMIREELPPALWQKLGIDDNDESLTAEIEGADGLLESVLSSPSPAASVTYQTLNGESVTLQCGQRVVLHTFSNVPNELADFVRSRVADNGVVYLTVTNPSGLSDSLGGGTFAEVDAADVIAWTAGNGGEK